MNKENHDDVKKKIEIIAETQINPTEDTEKVSFTLKNIFPESGLLYELNNVYIKSNDIEILKKIKEQIKSKGTLAVLRRILYNNYNFNNTSFLLNKQAAFSGVVAMIDNEDESPLGPIKITIKNYDLDSITNWFEK